MDRNERGKKLMEVMMRLKRSLSQDWTSRITQREYFVLRAIDAKGGMRITELSRTQHITMPAASQTLNLLEEKGYISRRTEKDDRRAVFAELTEEGRTVMTATSAEFMHLHDEIIRRLGEDNVDTLYRLFCELADVVEDILHPNRNDII